MSIFTFKYKSKRKLIAHEGQISTNERGSINMQMSKNANIALGLTNSMKTLKNKRQCHEHKTLTSCNNYIG